MPPRERTERGFGVYAKLPTTMGDVVEVQESSVAFEGPHVWLRTRGEAHLMGAPVPVAGIPHGVAPATLSAHLSVDQAKAVIGALNEWLADVETGGTTESQAASELM